MTFGEKLQSLRQRAGMSQDALAERLQVSRQAVSRWERDETMPETDKVVALADIFGVTTDYLLRLQPEQTEPEDVASIEGFTDMTETELEAYRKEMGFAMSAEDIKFVQEYYRDTEKRQPTVTEIKVIDTYWSDHCRHTTFNTALYDIEFEESPYGSIVKEAFERYLVRFVGHQNYNFLV